MFKPGDDISPAIGGDTTPSISPPNFFVPPKRFSCPPHFSGFLKIWGGTKNLQKSCPPQLWGGQLIFFEKFLFPPKFGGDITSPKRCFPPNAFVSPPNRLSPPNFSVWGGNISIFGEILGGNFVNFPPNRGGCPPQSYPPCFENGPLLDALFLACPPQLGGKRDFGRYFPYNLRHLGGEILKTQVGV